MTEQPVERAATSRIHDECGDLVVPEPQDGDKHVCEILGNAERAIGDRTDVELDAVNWLCEGRVSNPPLEEEQWLEVVYALVERVRELERIDR